MGSRLYRKALRHWQQRPILTALFLSLATRTVWFATATVGMRWSPPLLAQPGTDGAAVQVLPSPLRAMWIAWDSLFYLDPTRAEYGGLADERALHFFPLFSLLVRTVAALSHLAPPVAGLLVANACDCVGWVLVALWLRRRLRVDQAMWAMLAFALFPARNFGLTAYSEGLFLSLSMAAFLTFDAERFVWASVFSALVAAVRPQGILVGLALGVSLLVRARAGRTRALPRLGWTAFLLLLACPIGMLAHAGCLLPHPGGTLPFFATGPTHLINQASLGWRVWRKQSSAPQDYGAMALTGGALLKMLRRKRRPEDWLYLLFSMGLPLSFGQIDNWFRHCGVLPPLFAELGLSLRGRHKKTAFLAIAAVSSGVMAYRMGQAGLTF